MSCTAWARLSWVHVTITVWKRDGPRVPDSIIRSRLTLCVQTVRSCATIVRQSVTSCNSPAAIRSSKRTGSGDRALPCLREYGPAAPTRTPRPRRWRRPGTTPSSPTCSTTTGRRRRTTRSGRSPTTSAASTTPRDRFAARRRDCDGWPYAAALELGCGTGFFLLNLMQAGRRRRAATSPTCRPGMVAAALRNAAALGLDVDGRVADAESIPYDDATFDLVVGHAVLHHIPDVELALREVLRVLKPGGRFVFAGEPTPVGDWYARRLGRAHLEGRDRGHPAAARCADWRPAAGGARRVVAGGGAGVGRRPPHVRPGRRWPRRRSRAGAVDVRASPRSSPRRSSAGRCARSRPRCSPGGSAWAGRCSPTGLAAAVRAGPPCWPGVVPRRVFYNAVVTGTRPLP